MAEPRKFTLTTEDIEQIVVSAELSVKVNDKRDEICGYGESFRQALAIDELHDLPNPADIAVHVDRLNEYGLTDRANKLRTSYEHLQNLSKGDLRTVPPM